MKLELVGFYPITEKNREANPPNLIATVHLYVVDYKLDLRGIRFTKNGKRRVFLMPLVFTADNETGLPVSFPVFRWTDEKDHKAMLDFLHHEVKPKIFAELEKLGDPDFQKRKPNVNRNRAGNALNSSYKGLKNFRNVNTKPYNKNSTKGF